MDMQEGVLLGVCRGCDCSREWIPRQKKAAPPQQAGCFLCRRRGALGEETLGKVAKTNGGGGSTRSVEFRRKTVGSRWRHFFGPSKINKEINKRAGWSSAEGSRIG
ncbi:hypothetical protein QVD17_12081 [Tagetes erecta]|uniref:Uncharacterized protein n=1 Tax=Tagetes erecta TaxID=13708 RepID=A0AAD8P2M3_TARER|nr:hypothetical protein QVD17_12081 [Tagetes erecta]